MDNTRRNRRKKCRMGLPVQQIGHSSSPSPAVTSYLSNICSYLILFSLIAIVYLLLEYNCNSCMAKCDLNSMTKHVENISNHLLLMKDSYLDLQKQVLKFSHELPKFEGQLEILEALANTLDTSEIGWDPKTQQPLPYVDVSLNEPRKPKNTTLNKKVQESSLVNIGTY